MKRSNTWTALALTAGMLCGPAAVLAQDHHDDHGGGDHGGYVQHKEWRKGGKISHDDWNRGQQVDWHSHHLNAPPRGYEWRQVDGNYVLAAAATGVIASALIASQR